MFQGYRELNDIEISRIDRIKRKAEEVRELCKDTAVTLPAMVDDTYSVPDPRWIAIAETHMQQGFMALTRAIAKPTSF